MSTFQKTLQKHQEEIERMIEKQERGSSLSYSMMLSMGMLKPFAVRLPVTLIAVLDEVAAHGLWRSKQEMVYDMIQGAFEDFIAASSEQTRNKCIEIQQKSLDAWNKKNKSKGTDTTSKSGEAGEKKNAQRKSSRGRK